MKLRKNDKIRNKFKTVMFLLLMCYVFTGCIANGDKQTENKENSSGKSETVETIEYRYPYVITPTRINDINFCIESEDIFLVAGEGKFGYIRKDRKELSGCIYEDAYPFSEGVAAVSINGKYGFIDRNGEEAIGFIYDDLKPFSEGLAYFAKDKEYGFLKKDGTVAFLLDCDSVSSFKENKAYFSVGGKYGYIDQAGQIVIPAEYNDADYYQDGVAFVSKNGGKGAIDSEGEIVIPLIYDDIYRTNECIYAEKNGNTDYYNFNGEKISKEKADGLSQIKTEEKEMEIYCTLDEGRVVVYDGQDKKLLSVSGEYLRNDIYQDTNNFIVENFEGKDLILLLEENQKADLSEVILRNSITPRKAQYYQVVKELKEQQFLLSEYAEQVKYYDVDNSGEPIMYYYVDDLFHFGFPLSNSSVYTLKDAGAVCILFGEECGGSARGSYVCFWKDNETGQIRLGLNGESGGFGGFEVSSSIYDYLQYEPVLIMNLNEIMWNQVEESEYYVNDTLVDEEVYFGAKEQYVLFKLY